MALKVLKNRRIWLALSLIVIFAMTTANMTIAYEKRESAKIVNTFIADNAGAKLVETFDGTVKKNVTVTNSGGVVTYIRIQLVTYRVNDAGERIGGTATVPTFTPGEGWLNAGNGLYIYSKPVGTKKTTTPLIGAGGITLQKYTDADGGKQVVDVIADCIQSNPAAAVQEMWGVTVGNNAVLALKK